jgi:hypothetical protein
VPGVIVVVAVSVRTVRQAVVCDSLLPWLLMLQHDVVAAEVLLSEWKANDCMGKTISG